MLDACRLVRVIDGMGWYMWVAYEGEYMPESGCWTCCGLYCICSDGWWFTWSSGRGTELLLCMSRPLVQEQ
jgi:hypothetical protein